MIFQSFLVNNDTLKGRYGSNSGGFGLNVGNKYVLISANWLDDAEGVFLI